MAGRVVEVSEHGVCVQSAGDRIPIIRVKLAGGGKIAAAERVAAAELRIGDQFDS